MFNQTIGLKMNKKQSREDILLNEPLFMNGMIELGVTELEFCKALALILCRHVRVFGENGLRKVDWGFDYEAALQDVSELECRIHEVTTEWDDLKIGFFIANWQHTIAQFCSRYGVDTAAEEFASGDPTFEDVLRRMFKVMKSHPVE